MNNISPQLLSKSQSMLSIGYNRELTYQHDDHSFSAFGKTDLSGSLWLTSFVVKCFSEAKQYTFIDDDVIKGSVEYIVKQQQSDGSFRNTGNVVHGSQLFGGASGGIALTAYVTLSLIESKQADRSVELAVNYLQSQLSSLSSSNDMYAKILIAHTLTVAGVSSSSLSQLIADLKSQSINDTNGRHWSTASSSATTTNNEDQIIPYCYGCQGSTFDVEATSYMLLTLIAKNELSESIDIVRWLTSQQNSAGGFYSTQDTVVGLKALAEYGKATLGEKPNMNVVIQLDNQLVKTVDIKPDNFDLLQTVELSLPLSYQKSSSTPRQSKLSLTVSGSGRINSQLSLYYNSQNRTSSNFNLHVDYVSSAPNDASNSVITVKSCFTYTGSETDVGMTITEIGLQTGYQVDTTSLQKLQSDTATATNNNKQYSGAVMKRYELGDRSVILYWENLKPQQQTCFSFSAVQSSSVSNSKSVVGYEIA